MKVTIASDGLYIEWPFTDDQFGVDLNGFAPQGQTSPAKIAIRFYPTGSEEQNSVLVLAHQLRAALDTAIMRHTYAREETR